MQLPHEYADEQTYAEQHLSGEQPDVAPRHAILHEMSDRSAQISQYLTDVADRVTEVRKAHVDKVNSDAEAAS